MDSTTDHAKLSADDRAYMLYVARRDYLRGAGSREEYLDVVDRCRIRHPHLETAIARVVQLFSRRSAPVKTAPQRSIAHADRSANTAA